ncbi:hypothetical protein BH10ACI2_BH10ACI2_12130 [soil metagenome]
MSLRVFRGKSLFVQLSNCLFILKIKPQTEPDLTLPVCTCRHEEVIACQGLSSGWSRTVIAKRLQVDEFGSVAKNRCVQNVAEFDHGTETLMLADLPFTRHAQVKCVERRAGAGVTRQIAALRSDRLQCKLRDQSIGDRRSGVSKFDVLNIAAKIDAVGAEVVKIAVRSAIAEVKRSRTAVAKQR